MEYLKQSHCVYYNRYHVVVSTKYRRKIFNSGVSAYLQECIKKVSEYYPEIVVYEINTDKDHMHILISVAPKMSISDAVEVIKANTSRMVRRKFEWLDKVYWGSSGVWSIGYFVTTVGVNEKTIQKYIQMQGVEDSGRAKLVLS